MFTPRHIHRSLVVCGLAGALLASAMTTPAAARPIDQVVPTSSLAGTTSATPRQDLRSPDARDAARADEIALAVKRFEAVENVPAPERRYWAYPKTEPVVTAQSPAPSDDTPWLPSALSIAAGLVIAAVGAAEIRRIQVRRRRTAGATT
jgi:hypothetical protein